MLDTRCRNLMHRVHRSDQKRRAYAMVHAMTDRLSFRVACLLWLAVGLGVCGAGPAKPTKPPQITFEVFVPPDTPRDEEVWLAGNHAALGEWRTR